jgi:23S rRNA (cytosine1962-C5)-methyltransferase
VGQWGLHAARAGAEEVVCVDRSESALSFAASNAATNGLEISTTQSPVDRFLDETPDRSFDAIVCDPPSFIRSRKGASKGAKAYERLFARTLTKVRRGGYAVVASCSHHLFEDRFHKALAAAAYKARREVVVVVRGGQSPCHPVPATFPEARYLKAVLLEVR